MLYWILLPALYLCFAIESLVAVRAGSPESWRKSPPAAAHSATHLVSKKGAGRLQRLFKHAGLIHLAYRIGRGIHFSLLAIKQKIGSFTFGPQNRELYLRHLQSGRALRLSECRSPRPCSQIGEIAVDFVQKDSPLRPLVRPSGQCCCLS